MSTIPLPRPVRFPAWRTLKKTVTMRGGMPTVPPPTLGDYEPGGFAQAIAADLVFAIGHGWKRETIRIRWTTARRLPDIEREIVRRAVISALSRRERRLAVARLPATPRVTPRPPPEDGIREVPLYADVQLSDSELTELNKAKRWYWNCAARYSETMSDGNLQSRQLAYEAYFVLSDRLAGIVRLPRGPGEPWPGRRDPKHPPRCTNAHIDGHAERFNFTFKLDRRDDL